VIQWAGQGQGAGRNAKSEILLHFEDRYHSAFRSELGFGNGDVYDFGFGTDSSFRPN